MSDEAHTIPDHVASRVARLINEAEDMRQQAADDLKQIYADLREELRGMGWTGSVVSVEVAALKGAIADMRMDEQAKSKREEKGERIDDYVSLLTRARAREAVPAEAVRGILAPHYTATTARDYAEATGRDAGSSNGRMAEFDSADAGSNPAPVASHALVAQRIEQEASNLSVAGSIPAERSNAPDEGIPAFLKRDRKPLRPNCLNPGTCAGYGSHTCHSCTVAAREVEPA